MKFHKGQKVYWDSQSGGHYTSKDGVIRHVLSAYSFPTTYGYRPNGGPVGMPRNHESYLVLVGKRLYWPRVSKLRAMEG